MRLHHQRPGARIRIARVDQILDEFDAVFGFPLGQQKPRLDGIGGGLRLFAADLVQPADDPPGAGPVLLADVDIGQRAQQLLIGGVAAQGIDQHAFGRGEPAFPDQEAGIAQAFPGGAAGGFHGQGQPFAGQLMIAVALVSAGHQGEQFGIARSLIERLAQGEDGFFGLVVLDLPGGLHLQRRHMAGILGQHLLDLGARAHLVAARLQHARQDHPDIAHLRIGFHPLEDFLQIGDGLLLLFAELEIENGAHRLVKIGVRILPGGEGIELCARRLVAAGAAQKLDNREIEPGPVGLIRLGRHPAHEFLGALHIATAQIPGNEQGLHPFVIGEDPGHLAQTLAHLVIAPGQGQKAQPRLVQLEGIGLLLQRDVELLQRIHGVGAGKGIFDQHPARHGDLRLLRQHGPGLLHGFRPCRGIVPAHRIPVIEHRVHCPGFEIIGRKLAQAPGVALGFFPVAALDGHLGQGAPALHIIRVLLDQAQIVAVALGDVAAFAQQFRIGDARFAVAAVQIEHVAQLDHGPLFVALFEQFEGGSIVFLGPLFGIAEPGEKDDGADGNDEEEKKNARFHDMPSERTGCI